MGALLWWVTPFAPWQAALISLVITLLGFAGGLCSPRLNEIAA